MVPSLNSKCNPFYLEYYKTYKMRISWVLNETLSYLEYLKALKMQISWVGK